MRSMVAGIAVGLMVAVAGPGLWAGQRGAGPGSGTPQPSRTGVIVGRVVDAVGGQPVSEAQVTLALRADVAPGGRGAPAGPVLLLTGTDGRFVVRDVPVGMAQLTVQAPGYLNGSHGQTRPGGPSRPVQITAQARVVEATVRLWKYAVVSGIVTDEANEPAINITVRAMRRRFSGGRAQYASNGLGRTDDRGMYRISGLMPGDYVVVVPQTQTSMPVATMNDAMAGVLSGQGVGGALAGLAASGVMPEGGAGLRVGDQLVSSQSGAMPVMSGDGRMAAYLTQYYPGVGTPEQATMIVLTSGEERGGVDIRMPLVPTVRISGTVVGPDGPMANVPVRLVHPSESAGADTSGDVARSATAADGSFQLFGVPVGQYIVKVLRQPRPPLPAALANNPQLQALLGGRTGGPASPSDSLTLFADLPVSVEKDLEGLMVTLSAGATVSGRLEFVGAAAPAAMTAMTVTLTAVGAPVRAPATRVTEDGTFTTPGYSAGRYLMNATGRAPGWFVKSALVNGINAIEQPFELTTEDVGNVLVTFTDQQTSITGTVTGTSGAGIEATVVVFPAAHREWISQGMVPRLTRNVRSPSTGAFTIRGLPARDYLIVALADDDVPDLQDPSLYEALARVATPLTLAEGATRTVSLKLAEVVR